MNKRRIPAFTIMEVTITMLISALLVGITYTAFSIISRSYEGYNSKNKDMALILRLDELLRKDFNRAEIVLKDTAGITLKSNDRLVKYKFDPDYVLRIGAGVDTFKLKTDSLKISFENEILGDMHELEEQNRADEVSLSLVLKNERIPYTYHKTYSSANLFNRNPDALN